MSEAERKIPYDYIVQSQASSCEGPECGIEGILGLNVDLALATHPNPENVAAMLVVARCMGHNEECNGCDLRPTIIFKDAHGRVIPTINTDLNFSTDTSKRKRAA